MSDSKVERLVAIALSWIATHGSRDENGLCGYSKARYDEVRSLRDELLSASPQAEKELPEAQSTPLTDALHSEYFLRNAQDTVSYGRDMYSHARRLERIVRQHLGQRQLEHALQEQAALSQARKLGIG